MDLPIYLARIWNDITDYSKIKHLYIYAHQPHFYLNIVNVLKNSNNLNKDIKIYLLDSPPGMSGYRGFEETKKILLDNLNIQEDLVIPIPFLYTTSGMVNTLNESMSLDMYLNNHNLKDIMIVSPVFHLPRAFLSLVSVIQKNNNKRRVYCYQCGYLKDWDNIKYRHSQGLLEGTINELLKSEINRINKYHFKGDLISIKDGLNYLDKRD